MLPDGTDVIETLEQMDFVGRGGTGGSGKEDEIQIGMYFWSRNRKGFLTVVLDATFVLHSACEAHTSKSSIVELYRFGSLDVASTTATVLGLAIEPVDAVG